MNRAVILAMLISVQGVAQTDTINQGVNFEQQLNWHSIKQKAMTENKYIFVDVYTTWCAPCKRMDKEVYADPTIGSFLNDKFISVKIQMDSTSKDGERVKKWYADASRIKQEYAIPGYPGYLFFTSDGRLIFKDWGYKSTENFIKLAENVISSKNLLLSSALEDYKKGKKDYKNMRDLALYARSVGSEQLAKDIAEDYLSHLREEQKLTKPDILLILKVVGNKELALKLAKQYKERFMNNLPQDQLLVYENLEFISNFRTLINSNDPFFNAFYTMPDSIDRIVNKTGWARFQVEQTIAREEINSKKNSNNEIDWKSIQKTIQKKYTKVDAEKIVLENQIRFYRMEKPDWKLWAKYKDRFINKYPPVAEGLGMYLELNVSGAWDAFLYCNDKATLKTAVKWINMALEKDKQYEGPYLDTKANLLYKLGRVDEAIQLEEKAIIVDEMNAKKAGKDKGQYANTFAQTLDNMKRRKPTYLDEGAIWSPELLPSNSR